jgi:hypothetical protein
MSGSGTLTTELVRFNGRHLFVNAKGHLRAEVLDENGRPIAPFTLDNAITTAIAADGTKLRLAWKGAEDLSVLAGRPVRFRFTMENGDLFAFWVSPDERGSSRGYVAAGGPEFAGAKDE